MAFLDKLKAGLSKTKNAIIKQVDDMLKSFVKVDEELLEELEELAYNSAYKYSNYNNNWVDLGIVAKEIGIPVADLQQVLQKQKEVAEMKDTVYTNILQVLEYIKPGEVTPFEYNSEKIKEIIISRRKQELLLNLQRDILNDALNNNKLKIIEENDKVTE